MKRMYSKEELVQFIKDNSEAIIEALNNKDISIAGLTSKGIANTGSFGNIGDVVVSGDVYVQKDDDENGNLEIEGNLEIAGKLFVGTPNFAGYFTPKADIPEGLEWGANSYLRFEVYGNILYIVIEAQIVNTTESAITTGTLSFNVSDLPDELCEKIIRRDGSDISENYSSSATISVVPCIRGTAVNQLVINSYEANKLGGYFDSFSLGANSSVWLSGRLFLTL